MSAKILVVDDDVALTHALEQMLADAGYIPLLAHTAEDGVHLALLQHPDLVLLDIMVPSMGGWEACRRIREVSQVPIIFFTALGNVEDIVTGLEMGADDYLVKPLDPAEFLARVKAHLRRMQKDAKATQKLVFGDGELTLDLAARIVTVGEREVELTPREFELFATLATNAGRVVTTADLVRQAWDMHDEAALDNIKPYIHYLRKKIEADPAAPRWIVTVRGVGYRFADE